jgi:hypothetical protein
MSLETRLTLLAEALGADVAGLLPRGLVIDTDTSFSAGITWPTISFGVQRFEPASPPDQSVRFMGVRRFEYNTPFNNFGSGHQVGGLDWFVQTGLGNPNLAYAHEAKIDNETTATITTAVGSEAQLSSNAGTITNLFGYRARITGNAGTIGTFTGHGVDVSGSPGVISNVIGYEFPDLTAALPSSTRTAYINRDPSAPILSAGPVIDQSITYASPAADGFTVAVPDYKQVILVMPAAAYASGTIVMPAQSLLHDGQSLEVLCTQAVAALTWGYNGATFVFNAPVAIAAGQVVRLKYYQAIDWWIADGTKEIDTVVGLQAALNAKQATLASGDTIKTINGESVLGSGDLVIEGGGGAADWTYVFLASPEISIATAPANTALAFTPAAATRYEIEVRLYMQAAATTTGVRFGIRWPTAGMNQNAAWMISPNTATGFSSRFWGNTSPATVGATGVPVANEGLWGGGFAMMATGATTAGDFFITLATEIAGSEARLMENSFIRYRAI